MKMSLGECEFCFEMRLLFLKCIRYFEEYCVGNLGKGKSKWILEMLLLVVVSCC